MAVIYCPDCKREMSDTASVCPNCGYPYEQKKMLYLKALKLMQGCTTSDGYLGVAEIFHSISEFQDAEALEKECRVKAGTYYEQEVERARLEEQERIRQQEELRRKQEEEQEREEKQRREQNETFKRTRKRFVIGAFALLLLVIGIKVANNISFKKLQDEAQNEIIFAGYSSTVAVREDGTVVTSGDDTWFDDAPDWTDVIAVATDEDCIIALKDDGTVVGEGNIWIRNPSGSGLVQGPGWTDMIQISASCGYVRNIVGLKSNGTVVTINGNDFGEGNVSDWTDIVAVSAGSYHTVGLKSDGTVVAVGDNDFGQCDVSGWTDIVAVSAGHSHTVGLKSDGTVVAVGDNDYGQCDVSGWSDIVAVSAGGYHTVGLKSDGTVVATGDNSDNQCDVSDWTDIVAVSAGFYHTVGLKSDGTVVAVGNNDDGQCDVSGWTDIKIPD